TDPLICSFGGRGSDLVLLGYVNAGRVGIRHGRRNDPIGDHAMVLVDCDRSAVLQTGHYDLTYLELPRSLVSAIMGSDPVPRGAFMRSLPNTGLVPLLRGHLNAMARGWHDLDAAEAASAMNAASSLAISFLARFHRKPLERRET